MASVQFYGVKSVISAYETYGISTWAIMEGRYIIRSGVGVEELRTYLNLLKDSPANYTLRLYEDIEDTGEITSKLEANGQFGFKLDGNFANAQMSGPLRAGAGPMDVVSGKIQEIISKEVSEALEKKFSGQREPETVLETVTGILKDPQQLSGVIDLVTAVRGLFNRQAPPLAAVAGTRNAAIPAEQKMQRIADALDILEKHDPKILEHLEKLAMLAQDDPDTFNLAIKKIDLL